MLILDNFRKVLHEFNRNRFHTSIFFQIQYLYFLATILLEITKSKHYNYNKTQRKNKKNRRAENKAMKAEKKVFYKKLIALV